MTVNTDLALKISTLPLYLVDLSQSVPQIACPGCGRWLDVAGRTLPVHRGDNKPDQPEHDRSRPRRPRCPASGRLVDLDLNPLAWAAQRTVGSRDARMRHGSRTEYSPTPPIPAPVFRLAAR